MMIEGLRGELKEALERHNVSQREVSRSIGCSSTAVSQWLSGTYPGNTEKIDRAVRNFLRLLKERASGPKTDFEFVETTAAEVCMETCSICHVDQEIGVIYGNAGFGKTEGVKEYARRHPDVVLIESDLGYTAIMLFSELAKKLGLYSAGRLHEVFNEVVGKLRGSGRLVIVDEAENLPYRALELLRRLWDKAGIGIVLVGMPRLIANLRGKRGEYAQLYSRVGIATRLDVLTERDTQMLINSVLPKASDLYKTYYLESRANARALRKLINRSIRMAASDGTDVTKEIIVTAAQSLII